jgi:class 3 adenylate cyclase/pimeloyl-ACP methyl ester carboxylesterase
VRRRKLVGVADLAGQAYVTTSDGGSIAYQVSGAGPLEMLVLPATGIPVDVLWDEPGLVRARNRFDAFSRTIWFEQRGWGSSDREVTPARSLEEAVTNEQLTAVADAVGSERFALLAFATLGPWALRYAAAHPERVRALILYDTFASYVQDEECPWGFPIHLIEHQIAGMVAESWGTGAQIDFSVPSRKDDDQLRNLFARGERLGATPSYAGERVKASYLQDARDCLSSIRAPTLVLHRRDDVMISVEAGRYLGEHIPGAKYVELPGADTYFFFGDSDAVIDEIEEFLTGNRSGAEGDVVVSTVLFTDIADSTRQAAALGHRAWSTLTQDHDTRVRYALARHRGREIKTMGDGFLATFDSAGRAIHCAADIVTSARGIGLSVRAGIHIGDVEFRDGDVMGLSVTIGKRVCDLAAPGQVLMTESVRGAIVGSKIELASVGEHTLKGVPGTWHLFAATS